MASFRRVALLIPAVLVAAASAQPQTLWTHPLPDRPVTLAVASGTGRVAVGYGRQPCSGFPGPCPGYGGYRVLDPADGSVEHALLPYGGIPNDLAITADGTLLGVGVGDAEVRRVNDGVRVNYFPTASGSSFDVAFNPAATRIFVGTTPGIGPGLHVYSLATGEVTNTFGLVPFVAALGRSPSGALLATADDNRNVMVFNVTNPDAEQLVRVFEEPNPSRPQDPYAAGPYIFGLAVTPDDALLATMSPARVNIWRLSDGTLLHTLDGGEFYPEQTSGQVFNAVAISPDGTLIAGAGYEVNNAPGVYDIHGTVDVWRLTDGAHVARYEEGFGRVAWDVAFSPDGAAVYAAVEGSESGAGSMVHAIATPASGPACNPDLTGDGNVDQNDVACIIDVVAGNPGCTTQDPDFNADGNVDQEDVAAVISAVAGGGCP